MTTEQARSAALASAGGAVLVLSYIVLRQVSVVEHLPDPPGEVWDSDGIVMSKAAHPFGIPDGVIGLASYAVTAGLIASGSELVRVKLVADVGSAGFNVVRQVVEFRKVCSWCMLVAACTGSMVRFGWKVSGR